MPYRKAIGVFLLIIASIALPFLLFQLYDDYFHEYYIHGFIRGLGPLLAAICMLFLNLALLSPLLYVLCYKFVDSVLLLLLPPIFIGISAFCQFGIMAALD
ncbi:hypothetical protein [Paenibacillus ferrarius]|uniref:hypothetical protein n=1 Tax=Paenibacillus ferrarius TaxID=1469647 RepID=UPI003D26F769